MVATGETVGWPSGSIVCMYVCDKLQACLHSNNQSVEEVIPQGCAQLSSYPKLAS